MSFKFIDHEFSLTSTHEEMIWIKKLETEQSEYAFDAEGASIDKVSVEQIRIRFRRKPIFIKDVHKIVELTMNVSADGELVLKFDIDKRGLFA